MSTVNSTKLNFQKICKALETFAGIFEQLQHKILIP